MAPDAVEAAQQEREREREHSFHQHNLNGHGQQTPEELYASMLNSITETTLREGSKEMLRNLLTKDFVLANLDKAQLHEFKWKLECKFEYFIWMHPSDDCLVVGDRRAAINDDPADRLRPLTFQQKWEVMNVFDGIWMRVTRALNMRQQEMLKLDIRESRVDRGERGASGNGIIDKLRGA